jgi:YesN/AraC family two-component response regulator
MRMPPGIDGMETARRIRALDPWVEIVIMTAYSDYSYKEIVQEVGNPERLLYFHKPFDPDQITQLVISITQRWQLDSDQRESSHGKIYQKLLKIGWKRLANLTKGGS